MAALLVRGHSSGEDLPPVNEPGDIDGQPAVCHLDFDSAPRELIDEGDHYDKAHADQQALQQAGLRLVAVHAAIEMAAFCAQILPSSVPNRTVQAAPGWCRERESNPHEVAIIGSCDRRVCHSSTSAPPSSP